MKNFYTGLLISLMTCSLTAQTFIEVTGTPFEGVMNSSIAFADIDNDNDKDVLITGENSSGESIAKLYSNNGFGSYSEITGTPFVGVSNSSIDFVDIDNDNDQDVIITGENNFGESIANLYCNDGFGNFTEEENSIFDWVILDNFAFADIDNDNDQDVLVMGTDSTYEYIAKLFINDGYANFEEMVNTPFAGGSYSTIAFADVDNDTDMDILITASHFFWWETTTLYTNNGNGFFTESFENSLFGVFDSSISFADIDEDNDLDVLISGIYCVQCWTSNGYTASSMKLYKNDGNGVFTEDPGIPFEEVMNGFSTTADVDNDNDVDVFIAGESDQGLPIAKLYINNGTGSFSELVGTSFAGVTNGSAAFANIDNDSDQDVIITGINNSGQASSMLYLNSLSGIANTCYYGPQTIITDSVAPNIYHLVDTTRGGGIETYNLNYSWDFSSSEWEHFVDDDNYWECNDPIQNEGATDAHWSMELFYDFLMEKYNRNSFDGNGAKMVTLVNLGNFYGIGFFSGIFAAFGGAPGSETPRTFIDHVGHEFSHGIQAYSSGLHNTPEAGAIAESYCNIIGTAVEFWAVPETASWLFATLDPTGKDMSDPNSSLSPGGTHYPDTYLGNYYLLEGGLHTIAHTNDAVQDYCFYLLSEGGSGTNDHGNEYSVEPIGIENATDIFYRAFTEYPQATRQFIDSRQATIQSAIDLYGECSNEVEQLIHAWYAVGVGPEEYTRDLALTAIISPENNCDLSAEEILEVEVLFHVSGCSEMIPAGSEIEMKYQWGSAFPVAETWVLDEDFFEGDLLTFSFSEPLVLPAIGEEQSLNVWVEYSSDAMLLNNSVEDFKVERKFEYDGNAVSFEDPGSSTDGFYIHTGSFARAEIDTAAKNTGEYGFLMSVIPTKSNPSPIPDDPSLNFEQQEELISEICFCVDATDWEDVSLYFDMKQTHSELYKFIYGSDSTKFLSSMRMLINGEQFGEQFHPDTYFDDPFVTYNYNLSPWAGTYFEFCFQSKNYVDDEPNNPPMFTYDSQGDNTFLDNIHFVDEVFTGRENLEAEIFKIYPNPAGDFVYLQSSLHIEKVQMINTAGQLLIEKITTGDLTEINTSDLEPGMYFIKVFLLDRVITRKLVIE